MAQQFSRETQELLERADQALEESLRLWADHQKVRDRVRAMHRLIEMGLDSLLPVNGIKRQDHSRAGSFHVRPSLRYPVQWSV
jgi:hypothetical protein